MKHSSIFSLSNYLLNSIGLLAAVALFLSPVASHAELLVYEGFDYDVDSSIEFQNGGTGWSDSWSWRVNFDGKGSIVFNGTQVLQGSLGFENLQVSGNHVKLYGDLGQLELARGLAQVIEGTAGTSTYISYIGQRVGPLASTEEKPNGDPWDDPETSDEVETYPWGENLYPRGASLRFWNIDNGEALGIGNFSNQETDEWMVFGSGLLHPSGVSFSEAIAFVVVRIDHVGDETVSDNIYLWVNPDLSAGEDVSTAQVQLTPAVDLNDDLAIVDFSNLSWISPYAGHASGDRPWAEMLMDEIRVGTTWESVTPTGSVVQPTRIIELSGTLDFGDVLVGEAPSATMSIANSGTDELNVTGIVFPDGFSGDWTSGSVAAGGSQDVVVTFSPGAVQAYGGDITVESDATSGTATLAVSGAGMEDQPSEWAGFAIVNEAGDVDTGGLLGWINVANAPLILSYTLDTYLFMEESYVSNVGAWGYLYNQSTDAPMGGDATWAGYTVLSSNDVETRRFLGWINVLQAPYVFSYSFNSWIYMPENFVTPAGSWGFLFKRN